MAAPLLSWGLQGWGRFNMATYPPPSWVPSAGRNQTSSINPTVFGPITGRIRYGCITCAVSRSPRVGINRWLHYPCHLGVPRRVMRPY